jgi:hypothetical protein
MMMEQAQEASRRRWLKLGSQELTIAKSECLVPVPRWHASVLDPEGPAVSRQIDIFILTLQKVITFLIFITPGSLHQIRHAESSRVSHSGSRRHAYGTTRYSSWSHLDRLISMPTPICRGQLQPLTFACLGLKYIQEYGIEELQRGDDADDWEALRRLLNRKWFTRVWVVQELGLARDATVRCGDCTLELDDLHRFFAKAACQGTDILDAL